MATTLENLWNEYFSTECARIETKEAKELMHNVVELHDELEKSLTKEQYAATEKYIDALMDAEATFTKNAFLKGCEFAVAFLLQTKAI